MSLSLTVVYIFNVIIWAKQNTIPNIPDVYKLFT